MFGWGSCLWLAYAALAADPAVQAAPEGALARAQAQYAAGLLAEAEASLARPLEDEATDLDAWSLRSVIRRDRGDLEGAVHAAQVAVHRARMRQDPSAYEHTLVLGDRLREAGRREEAMHAYVGRGLPRDGVVPRGIVRPWALRSNVRLARVRAELGAPGRAEYETRDFFLPSTRTLPDELAGVGEASAEQLEHLVAFGEVLGLVGRLDEAEATLGVAREELARRAARVAVAGCTLRALAHRSCDLLATASLRLAEVRALRGHREEAEDLVRQALARLEDAWGPSHPAVLEALDALAAQLIARGAVEEAVEVTARAVGITRSQSRSHADLAGRLRQHAGLLIRTEASEAAALEHFREALAVDRATLPEESPRRAIEAARQALREGRVGEGYAHLTAAMRAEEKALAERFAQPPELQRALLSAMDETLGTAITLALVEPSEEHRTTALEGVLRRRGRLLDLEQDLLADARRAEDDPRRRSARGRQEVRGPARLYREIHGVSAFAGASPETPVAVEQLRGLYNVRMAAVEVILDLVTKNAGWFRRPPAPVEIAEVASGLSPGAALLEIVRYRPDPPGFAVPPGPGERFAGLVLRANGHHVLVDLGSADAITAHAEGLRAAIVRRAPIDTARAAVYAAVVEPFAGVLAGVTRLVVAQEGALGLVPFDVVLGGSPLEGTPVTYVGSGRELVPEPSEENAGGPPLVIHSPDYDANLGLGMRPLDDLGWSRPEWRPLSGTAPEGAAVQEALGDDVIVLSGAAATETAVRQVARPRVLHVATHGFFGGGGITPGDARTRSSRVPQAPEPAAEAPRSILAAMLDAGVVLAGANEAPQREDNGLLTAAEILALDLRGTAVAVLSACDTGVASLGRSADGVVGLRRALTLAGARSQVLSHWKVDDEATAALMAAFYARLGSGATVAEALEAAKAAVRAEAKWAHPFYWAAFTLSGDPGARI